MDPLDPHDEEGSTTVFRDVIFLALAGFIAIVLMLLPHLNPPTKAEQDITTPGNVVIEAVWSPDIDADVDLWVEAPGDRPVGYSNKGGDVFNLLRDDLGYYRDATHMNYEVSYSRGLPAGEYTVNLHLYKAGRHVLPVGVRVVVSIKVDASAPASRVLSKTFELRSVGQEITCFRFKLDDEGKFVPSSVHDVSRQLRSARS